VTGQEREELLTQLLQARQEMTVLMQRRPWLHLDMTMGQVKAMVCLNRGTLASVSEVADHLRISRPAASMLVDRLVQLELVSRTEDAQDRRRTVVALTPKGRDFVDELLSGPTALRGPLNRMPLEGLRALVNGTVALMEQVKQDCREGVLPGSGEDVTKGSLPGPEAAVVGTATR
jgi:DNA-binding MarR family transcriptional regulator